MFDKLFDAVLVSHPWVALVPVTLHEDSIEELTWYLRAVHLDHMACPAEQCPEGHGLNATFLDLSKTSRFVTLSCHLMHMIDLRDIM